MDTHGTSRHATNPAADEANRRVQAAAAAMDVGLLAAVALSLAVTALLFLPH